MSTVLNVIKLLVVVYLIVLCLLYLFQGRLIFFAQPINNPQVAQFAQYEKTFSHDGVLLQGWYIKKGATNNGRLIIYYGGNAEEVSGNLLDLERFPEASLLFVNYRGYGNSQGQPTERNLVNDALFILDEMVKSEGIAPDQVFLLGRSLGSGVAVQVAAKRKVAGIILVTPFDSLVNVAKAHYPIFPVSWLIKHRFESFKLAGRISIPALNLMGTSDRIIPNSHSEALAKAWAGPIKTVAIKQADHNDIQLHQAYWTAIQEFVENPGG